MKKLLGVLLSILSLGDVLHAAPGDLDTSFSQNGKVVANFGGNDQAAAIAIQADGKIVAAGGSRVNDSEGDFALARYRASGTLDPSFDGDGRVTTSLSDFSDFAQAVAIQPDGRIVVAGSAGSQFALVRYNADGSLDNTFGIAHGIVSDAFLDTVGAVAIQADGKIVVAGQGDDQFALARFTSDGALDTTFPLIGGGGVLRLSFFGLGAAATALALLPDGAIVAAGFTNVSDFALAKITSASDVQYAVTVDLGESDGANALALQADGRIVMAGVAHTCLNPSTCTTFMAVARFNADGTLDTTFDGNGSRIINFGDDSEAEAVAIQPDGKIVVAGVRTENNIVAFALARMQPDGGLDFSFSGDGLLTTDFGSNLDAAAAMAIQARDGRIVVAGRTAAGDDFALARYHAFSCGSADVTRVGTNGPDALFGTVTSNTTVVTPLRDVIHGLGGDDTINGGGNNDTLCGGDGIDVIDGSFGDDVLFGGNGRDFLNGGSGIDTCNGGLISGDLFTSCETINTGLSGFSGAWLDLTQHCTHSRTHPQCRLAGALSVVNPGTETTAVPAAVAFYLSEDEQLDETDSFLATRELPVLHAGEHTVVRIRLELPDAQEGASGSHVIAVLDYTDIVAERNEENNVAVSPPIP